MTEIPEHLLIRKRAAEQKQAREKAAREQECLSTEEAPGYYHTPEGSQELFAQRDAQIMQANPPKAQPRAIGDAEHQLVLLASCTSRIRALNQDLDTMRNYPYDFELTCLRPEDLRNVLQELEARKSYLEGLLDGLKLKEVFYDG